MLVIRTLFNWYAFECGRIFKFINAFLFAVVIYKQLYSYILQVEMKPSMFYIVYAILCYVVNILMHHYSMLKLTQIRCLWKTLLSGISDQQRLRLQRIRLALITYWVLCLITYCISDFWFWQIYGIEHMLQLQYHITAVEHFWYHKVAVYISIFLEAYYDYGWFVATTCVYFEFLLVMYFTRARFLENLSFTSTQNATSIKRSQLLWNSILDLDNSFNDIFGMFPVLWLTILFVQNVNDIFQFKLIDKSDTQSNHEVLNEFFLGTITHTVPVLIILFENEIFNARLEESVIHVHINSLSCVASNEETYTVANELLSDIDSNKKVKLNGWDLFVFDKTLLLAFLGSIISFAVLFIQIFSTAPVEFPYANHTTASNSI